jgi:hypothetical protein
MPYYIEGEAETDFLIINKPEEIKLLDPACGSGHMLTYSFDLLNLIYEEDGYAPTEIPALILRHNLHGLEICPRAAQLAELALIFKAREKSRRFFQPEHLVRPRIIELRDVCFAESELRDYFKAIGIAFDSQLTNLLHQFEEAKNFGSLIQPCLDERGIAGVRRAIEAKDLGAQLFLRETHLKVLRVLEQAEALTQRYHVVVANPPYMGSGAMNVALKNFVEERYSAGKADLYGCFILRLLQFAVPKGAIGLITIPNWMFLGGFEDLRKELLKRAALTSLVQNGRGLWGADFGSCSFCITNQAAPAFSGVYRRLFHKASEVSSPDELSARFLDQKEFPVFKASGNDFRAIPGTPIAFWISPKIRHAFATNRSLGSIAEPRVGLQTGSNETFVRSWVELSQHDICLTASNGTEAKESGKKWFPYNKGGAFRKWFGNAELVVLWEKDGAEIKDFKNPQGKLRSRPQNTGYFFRPSVSWSKVSIGAVAFRYFPEGFIFDVAGCSIFPMGAGDSVGLLGFLNSKVAASVLSFLSPTMNYEVGHVAQLPIPQTDANTASIIVTELVSSAKADWDNFETSWDFRDQPLLRPGLKGATLDASWRNWEAESSAAIRRMQELETENNRLFINAYGLAGELQPEVPEDQITLARADVKKDIAAFLSYAVGCMMGRYSLDKPGLIYANSGNIDFEKIYFTTDNTDSTDKKEKLKSSSSVKSVVKFLPDEDGIIPLLNTDWGIADDATDRVVEFLKALWPIESLEENLFFISQSLGATPKEPSREVIRNYFSTSFYKDHQQKYKKRPIYWLFSSGKLRAFQCLVYLHRYNEGTLSRMRTEYVIPIQSRIVGRIEQLEGDKLKATSTSHRNKLQKEQNDLKKQQEELKSFEEKLKHAAERKIKLDLDDGVKVNYAKFTDKKYGEILAEVKAICGTKDED